jgi:hypothetical protein
MARRSRKRRRPRRPKEPAETSAAPAAEPAEPARPQRRRAPDERPPAPWGSFPLVELMVLIGLGLVVAGFIGSGYRATVMIGGGVVLCSLAGLELSVREHFAGYRSHTTLLAGTAGIVTMTATFLAARDAPRIAGLAAGAAVFGLTALWLRNAFRRRSGGASFRIGRFGG